MVVGVAGRVVDVGRVVVLRVVGGVFGRVVGGGVVGGRVVLAVLGGEVVEEAVVAGWAG